jgi:hypothetical protein
MYFGTHLVLYSGNPEADRAFLRDVLGFSSVDAGEGWLIFALPPAETGVHPGAGLHDVHGTAAATVYLMCRDLRAAMAALAVKGVACGPVHEEGWGSVSAIPLPGGSSLGLYEPHHATAVGNAT